MFGVAAAVITTVALFWWSRGSEAPITLPSVGAPSPTAGSSPPLPPVEHTLVPTMERSARPTSAGFDFAQMTPPPVMPESEDERFRTNDLFTKDDLLHPERYFERAEQVPELRRPEERRDVLDYFLAYREKLARDLEAAGDNRDRRQEILAVIDRYDDAIARLRKLLESTQRSSDER